MTQPDFRLDPIGILHSGLTDLAAAPRQGAEGAPNAQLELDAALADGLTGISVGDEVIVITWLHKAQRDTLQVHPRNDQAAPLSGVFATRSPARPNPLGLHRVTVLAIDGTHLEIGPIEAIDGTPVVDIRPVFGPLPDS